MYGASRTVAKCHLTVEDTGYETREVSDATVHGRRASEYFVV